MFIYEYFKYLFIQWKSDLKSRYFALQSPPLCYENVYGNDIRVLNAPTGCDCPDQAVTVFVCNPVLQGLLLARILLTCIQGQL